MIRIKRVYEPPDRSDGERILVDRLWPRGIRKDAARIDAWRKDLSPTNALRRWYDHDPLKWDEFRLRYRNELAAAGKKGDLAELRRQAEKETVTLLFSSRETVRNNAVALKEFLEEVASPRRRGLPAARERRPAAERDPAGGAGSATAYHPRTPHRRN